MGYTHYWNMPKDEISPIDWDAFCNIAKQIIKVSEVKICNGLGEGVPDIDNDDLFINGETATGEAFETFHINKNALGQRSFCKTNRRPYDEVVCAILIIGTKLGILTWSSDGKGDDFNEAKKLLDELK